MILYICMMCKTEYTCLLANVPDHPAVLHKTYSGTHKQYRDTLIIAKAQNINPTGEDSIAIISRATKTSSGVILGLRLVRMQSLNNKSIFSSFLTLVWLHNGAGQIELFSPKCGFLVNEGWSMLKIKLFHINLVISTPNFGAFLVNYNHIFSWI